MKNLLLSLILIAGFISLQAKEGYEVTYNKLNPTTSELQFTLGDVDFRNVNLSGTDFTKIIFDGSVVTKDKGFAELPFINANIQLGADNNVSLTFVGEEFTDYQLEFPLVPSRGVIYRDQDPSTIPYEIAAESITDAFFPSTIANVTDAYIIKDVRGTTVYVYPFQYNAATQTLRVYTSLTVQLTNDNTTPVNPLYSTSGKVYREMEGIYKSVFMNYEPTSTDDLTVGEAGDILVITTARDEDAIQPYIDWKMEKGYEVFKEVVATGTNVKTLIQTKYNENNDILYVQLVGDWADIKCDLGGGASAPMDPMLGCVVGSDNYPDIAIGRFSASSPTNVTVQVDKTINYEKNPSGDWYTKAIGVASNQGPGDDNELDYQQIDVIFDNKLEPFTYTEMGTAYDPSGTATQVKNYLEAGASIINYCGHGSMTSWGSTGFSNSNIATLTNGDMLPFIFSVACVNGAYHSGECFAEAWLKKENGGAIMTLMATINQPWDPPMRGQDYFNDILTGGYDYTSNPGNGISTDEGRTTIGAVVANGLTLMLTESSGSSDLQTAQTWCLFGDASLQFRTAAPADLAVSNTVMLVGSPFEATVTADGSPLSGAMVCLSQNGMYASTYTDANGDFSIDNEFLPGDVQMVVTGFNAETVYETIQCIPPTGPYVIFNAVEVNSASGMLEYGETSTIDLTLKNVGVSVATNVEVTISTSDMYVTITDATENFGNIAADEVKTMNNAFEIEVANDIPDGHSVSFMVVAEGEETWESSFTLSAVAGALKYGDFYVVDINGNNNGKLDPGETVEVFVSIMNDGSAEATGVMGELMSSDMYITIGDGAQDYGDLGAGDEGEMSFEVTADAGTPTGHMASFTFDITGDKDLSAGGSFLIVVGQIPVLIVDLDDNHNSAAVMGETLDEIGIPYDEATSLSGDLNLYSSVFVCLGIYSDNHQLSDAEGQQLADYLNAGGNLYMEGGDTWYYDDPTPVHDMFGLTGTSDGSGDLATVNGVNGTFTEGMSFSYNGANNWIDHLAASGTGVVILNNSSPAYGTAVANDAGSYMTIGASHEFGGLDGGRALLMEAYLNFFGMMPSTLVPNFQANVTEGCEGLEVEFTDASLGATSWMWTFTGGYPATSTEQNPTVVYNTTGDFDVSLEVSDGTNSTSMTKTSYITVMGIPGQAGPVMGDQEVGVGEEEDYMCAAMDECTLYNWVLTPATAGTMTMNMNEVTVEWSEAYTGMATLEVCGGNDCGMGEYSEAFEVMVYDYTGIDEVNGNNIELYPNPSNGQFNISLSTTQATSYELNLVNALGMTLLNKTIEVNGNYSESIDVSSLSDGVYYLYMKTNENSIIRKVVIQK
jgi:PKD repeat protein